MTKRDIARIVGVSDMAVGKAFRADRVGLEAAVKYLDAMDYQLYAVPKSLHIESISDEAIKLDRTDKSPD